MIRVALYGCTASCTLSARGTIHLSASSLSLSILKRIFLFLMAAGVASSNRCCTLPYCCGVRVHKAAVDHSTQYADRILFPVPGFAHGRAFMRGLLQEALYWVEDRPLIGSSLTSCGSLCRQHIHLIKPLQMTSHSAANQLATEIFMRRERRRSQARHIWEKIQPNWPMIKERVWTKHATGLPIPSANTGALFLHEFREESRWLKNSYKGPCILDEATMENGVKFFFFCRCRTRLKL